MFDQNNRLIHTLFKMSIAPRVVRSLFGQLAKGGGLYMIRRLPYEMHRKKYI